MKRFANGGLAALILGTTLIAATPAALGEESQTAPGSRKAAEPTEESRNRAADAHQEAVSQAADAVISATKLDLDIRLVGRTSVQVANDLN